MVLPVTTFKAALRVKRVRPETVRVGKLYHVMMAIFAPPIHATLQLGAVYL
jgi:hypothetical protein